MDSKITLGILNINMNIYNRIYKILEGAIKLKSQGRLRREARVTGLEGGWGMQGRNLFGRTRKATRIHAKLLNKLRKVGVTPGSEGSNQFKDLKASPSDVED